MIKNSILLLTALMFMAACGERPSTDLDITMEDVENGKFEVVSEVNKEIIENIASPLEVAALISSLNIPYSTSYLADPEKLSSSSTSLELAYNLGALSGNLGYLNMYEKTGTAINYLSSIKRMADALQIGHFFDFATFKQLATSSHNMDSLMFVSTNSFNKMDEYLRETGRSHLSALMITGVWIEGLYLATQVASQNNNEDLKTMIGEQKLILNDLLMILNLHNADQVIQGYISDLELIRDSYSDVLITYELDEPRSIEKDGMLMVIQSEIALVSIDEEMLNQIIEVTKRIRNKHLNMNS